MKPIEQIKKKLIAFGKKYNACEEGLDAIKGDNLKELFQNISMYTNWCKETPTKEKEFTAIFNNELVIDDGVLLCNYTNLPSIIIPDSVTTIGKGAFEDCIGLTSITIPNSVSIIENHAFAHCIGLTSITIPDSVTLIGRFSFFKCKGLTSIKIPDSVIAIGGYAFAYCKELTSVTIPNSVTSIGEKAFYNCREDLKIIRK